RIGMYNTYLGAQISWATPIDGLRVGYRFSGYVPQGGEVAYDYGAIENRFGFTYGKDGLSILGNFVPFPARATLGADESVTLEPMRGSLANLDRLELTVALATDNDRDRQTIMLQRE
ncbi:MAG TPA: hypothetical protein PLV87_06020, partial [Opitutaceae bacterium]|nr:hypothetical protein [Opitutaceae bacterium]